MKNLITIMALFFSVSVQSQKIISHTTTIGKFGDNSIEMTKNTDGNIHYTVYFAISDLKDVGGKLVNMNRERTALKFDTKENMLKCLHYLYDFDKGEGYYIDLENKSNHTAYSLKDGFIISSFNEIDKPIISKWLIGKLLNSIGVSVKKEKERKGKNDDDMYTNTKSLF